MAFVEVPDKAAGDTVSLANWNTHIRDNLNKGLWRPIADSLLIADATSVSFSSISATDFDNLMLIIQARGTTAATNTFILLQFNADAATNYDYQTLEGSAAVITAAQAQGVNWIVAGVVPAATATASVFGMSVVCIPNYRGTTFHKGVRARYGHKHGTSSGNMRAGQSAGFWRSASAINAIAIIPGAGNWLTGSRFTLLGASV